MQPGEFELDVIRQRAVLLSYCPRISLLLVVADEDEIWIKASVASVLGQIYPHFELCICDNASTRSHVAAVLQQLAASNSRVRICSLPERSSRARAYNEALDLATGEYVAVLDPGDEIPSETLSRASELLDGTGADLVYTDEDKIDVAGRPSDPTFKPPWSPELLLTTHYTGRLSIFRRSILEELKGFREESTGAEEHDLTLRFVEKSRCVQHLPGVFYRRRRFLRRTRPDGAKASPEIVQRALERREVEATVSPGLAPDSLRVVRGLPQDLQVSILLTADESFVEQHRRGLEENAGYPIHELVAAEFEQESPKAGARALNLAARQAEGEYLIFVDRGVLPDTPGWLAEMLSQARRSEVGTVSGKLLNSDGQIIPPGATLNLAQLGGEQAPAVVGGDYLPLPNHPFNFPASAKWMAVRRSVFEDAGGFDDANLPRAFYDLDLCFRLEEAGLMNIHTPYASAVYRGFLLRSGVEEVAHMWSRWWSALIRVLYYSRSPVEQGYDHATLDTVLAATLSGTRG